MLTVWPSCALISVRMPAAGDGISASTLSVEISKIGSSRWTLSPTFFSHLVMVPSVMDSPICGIRISVAAAAGAVVAGAAALGLGVPGTAGVVSAGAAAAPPMTATTVLICTVEPSAAFISVSTPAAGEGISASTLSVEISKIGSSRWTVSPTFFSHLVMVPSVMDSPICGISTSVLAVGAGAGGGAAASALGSLDLRRFNRRSRRRGSSGAAGAIEHGDNGIDVDRAALLHANLTEHTGCGRWDLGVHLVGGDLEERLVAGDRVANLL